MFALAVVVHVDVAGNGPAVGPTGEHVAGTPVNPAGPTSVADAVHVPVVPVAPVMDIVSVGLVTAPV